MAELDDVPVGRLAPSPTGLLHLGHARSFLLAWWSIRGRGGRILMRLEDLDGARSRPELGEQALRDLEWLGLDWDGEPLVQSSGLPRLNQAVETLTRKGRTYACVCSRAELKRMASAPQQGDAEPRYPGTCKGRFSSLEEAEATSGREAGLRFVVPEGVVTVRDEFAPSLPIDVAGEVGDFMIARRDKTPAYQLAVVADDAHQGVTEVLRGDDLLSSTARQWLLQEALDLPHPRWVHVPLVTDASGRRLAKRADDLGIATLRDSGVDPRAIVGWAARTSGMQVPTRVTARECIPEFALQRLPHEPVRLDDATLATLREAR
jgi:glutamyl-tRNA synthetase